MTTELKKIDKKAIELAIKLSADGNTYTDIADLLTRDGYRSITGLAITKSTVSALLIDAGHRKLTIKKGSSEHKLKWVADIKGGMTTKGKPRGRSGRRKKQEQPAQSKFALLSAIENCSGITGDSRKALLEIVFKELNK